MSDSQAAQGALDLFGDPIGSGGFDADDEIAGTELSEPPTLGVIDFAEAVNLVLRQGFGSGVWLRGEVEGLKQGRGGHLYFSLAEQDGNTRATLEVKLFKYQRDRVEQLLRQNGLRLDNGLNVRVFGIPDFYAPFGRLSLKMSDIDPRFTLGDLAGERDRLLRRLGQEGLLGLNKQLQFSLVPLRVGLVTSRGSAAWHDFCNELQGSGIGFQLLTRDTVVQGVGADASVADAVTALSGTDVDVIVVIRGGGAKSDLATFDSELIARAIVSCPLPVIAGIGHEIDRSVADEVAHTSVKTPTAAAAFLVERVEAFRLRSEHTWAAIRRSANVTLETAVTHLHHSSGRVVGQTHAALGRADERLGGRHRRIVTSARHHLDIVDQRVVRTQRVLVAAPRRSLERHAEHLERAGHRLRQTAVRGVDAPARYLDMVEARVRSADPIHLLRRGWSISRDQDGQVIGSVANVSSGAIVSTTTVDGTFTSRVEEVDPVDTVASSISTTGSDDHKN